MKKFPFYHQLDAMDCGPTCLRMIAKHYGRHYSLETLRQKCFIGREGVSILGISTAAEGIALLLEPTPDFYKQEDEENDEQLIINNE